MFNCKDMCGGFIMIIVIIYILFITINFLIILLSFTINIIVFIIITNTAQKQDVTNIDRSVHTLSDLGQINISLVSQSGNSFVLLSFTHALP